MILNETKIKEIMEREGAKASIACYDEIDSTNNEAKRLGAAGAQLPLLVTADRQTAGRGRLGRSFYSPSGTGTYESIAFKVEGSLESAVTVTSAAAVAVCRGIKALTGLEPEIKWVNDVYLNGGKVCGILAESFPVPDGLAVVVGVGINVTTEHFPEDIASRAASIGAEGIREELIARVAAGILKLREAGSGSFIDEYRSRSMVTGREITYGAVGEEPKPAKALAIDDDGGLVIELPNGERKTLKTGEITIRLR